MASALPRSAVYFTVSISEQLTGILTLVCSDFKDKAFSMLDDVCSTSFWTYILRTMHKHRGRIEFKIVVTDPDFVNATEQTISEKARHIAQQYRTLLGTISTAVGEAVTDFPDQVKCTWKQWVSVVST